jgi:hypothetical protein
MHPTRNPLLVALLFSLVFGFAAHGATLPSGFAETRVATGLASPTAMAIAPDGPFSSRSKAAHYAWCATVRCWRSPSSRSA